MLAPGATLMGSPETVTLSFASALAHLYCYLNAESESLPS